MKQKIEENLARGRYAGQEERCSAAAYVNEAGGWTDYLLGEQLIFSHRVNDYAPDEFPEDLHAHDYCELTVCAGGEAMQYVADRRHLSLQPGTVVLTHPMAVHMFRPLAPVRHDRYVLYFKPGLQLFPQKELLDFLSAGDETGAVFVFPEDSTALEYMRAAEHALEDRDSPYAAAAALLQIAGMFLALSSRKTVAEEQLPLSAPGFIHAIKRYVDEEFARIHTVGELAERFFYSREHITRSFRQYYNTSLYEYILRRKVLYCCALLRGGADVETAAARAGFHNHSSFVKVFRKFAACTPAAYKSRFLGFK